MEKGASFGGEGGRGKVLTRSVEPRLHPAGRFRPLVC
jgi:hypothetical protein